MATPAASANLVVATTAGAVRGTVEGPARAFLGIPYAAPPVGALRWRPPQLALRWIGVREATRPAPGCPQAINPSGAPNDGGYAGPTSEDCLTLDVVAPLVARGAPVMVWIFGGGDVAGATNLPSYDARAFARDGVVFVAMNYRLGALGFFAHPALDRAAPAGEAIANYGLMDQIAALKWVRRNIERFGGDPANVTLFGESAGGGDLLDLMAAPAARGLFQRAIVESGAYWIAPKPLAEAEADGAKLATKLGLPGGAASADQLRAVPASRIVAAEGAAGPVLDGRLLVRPPQAAFAEGLETPVPLMIGWNSNEASLMSGFGMTPEAVWAVAPPALKAAYVGDGPPDEAGRRMFNDEAMGEPARWYAAHHAGRAPTFLYYFSYLPTWQRGHRPGLNHASEIPMVFDSTEATPDWARRAKPEDRAEAALAHACWISFARTGTPSCGGVAWPAYAVRSDQLMEFGPGGFAIRTAFRKRQLDAEDAAHFGH